MILHPEAAPYQFFPVPVTSALRFPLPGRTTIVRVAGGGATGQNGLRYLLPSRTTSFGR